MSGRYEKKKEKKPAGWKKPVLIVLLVLVVLIAAVVVGVTVYYNAMLNKINKVEVPKINYAALATETTQAADAETTEAATEETTETTEATEPHVASSADYINILLVGQAAREGEAERFADTMILCTLNTYEKTITLTSLLRDTLVQYPQYTDTAGKAHSGGKIKLTTIYHNGYICTRTTADAMGLMNLTLYKNFGIEVDYDVEVDFEAFVKIIDLIGGVNVDLTAAEAKYLNDQGFAAKEGRFHLDGGPALCFARMRHADGDNDSDIIRTERQRRFMAEVLHRLKKLSLSDVQNIANEVLPMVTVSMSNSEITDLLLKLIPMLPDLEIVQSGSCPAHFWGEMLDIYGDGVQHSVLKYDINKTTQAMRYITKGEGELPEGY